VVGRSWDVLEVGLYLGFVRALMSLSRSSLRWKKTQRSRHELIFPGPFPLIVCILGLTASSGSNGISMIATLLPLSLPYIYRGQHTFMMTHANATTWRLRFPQGFQGNTTTPFFIVKRTHFSFISDWVHSLVPATTAW